MLALDSLVPGFDRTLDATPGARLAWDVLCETARGQALEPRTAALIHVAVAHRAGGEYARWAIERGAARQGLTAEDILLATLGTALAARESRIVRAARALALQARFADTSAYRDLEWAVGCECAAQVVSHVALAVLASEVLDGLAPAIGPARARARRGG